MRLISKNLKLHGKSQGNNNENTTKIKENEIQRTFEKRTLYGAKK